MPELNDPRPDRTRKNKYQIEEELRSGPGLPPPLLEALLRPHHGRAGVAGSLEGATRRTGEARAAAAAAVVMVVVTISGAEEIQCVWVGCSVALPVFFSYSSSF